MIVLPALRIAVFIIATVVICQLAAMVHVSIAWKWIALGLIAIDFGCNASARIIAWATIKLSSDPTPSADVSLYLRSFKVDNSTVYSGDSLTRLPANDRILRHMTRVAPPRKIINPERPLDAETGDVSDRRSDWINRVKPHAVEAVLVVVCLSETERGGLLDELEMVSKTNVSGKTIMMLPPLSAEFRSEWNSLRLKIAAKFTGCSSLNPLIKAILDTEPESHIAIFLDRNGQPQPIGRSAHNKSTQNGHDPSTGRWTWDQEVGRVFDDYIREHLTSQPSSPW